MRIIQRRVTIEQDHFDASLFGDTNRTYVTSTRRYQHEYDVEAASMAELEMFIEGLAASGAAMRKWVSHSRPDGSEAATVYFETDTPPGSLP